MPELIKLLEVASQWRVSDLDMVNFAWIGAINDDRPFHGIKSASTLHPDQCSRTVFWCETQNYFYAKEAINKYNKEIHVMRMRDLFRYWKQHQDPNEQQLATAASQVYCSLKRLNVMSAAKDLASLCILHVVGGYFFDASVKFLSRQEAPREFDSWNTDNKMPVRGKPAWCEDAWALYCPSNTDTARRALSQYITLARHAGLNVWFGNKFYPNGAEIKLYQKETFQKYGKLLTEFPEQETPERREERIGLIQDLIMFSLNAGWNPPNALPNFQMQMGFVQAPRHADVFEQRQIDREDELTLYLPEFALLKPLGSSVRDQSIVKGWKAQPFRNWNTKNIHRK